eukprot:CAMPEP_0178512478 /NCGR_PEP_ID=MMETSP0696-20121128/22913_1 /TAXON_ID=265572 /ORGANISM="Extubocellulus spinifer, Strain CCMP396" /LENGTH=207 /DNA_ID=CAMNT_0020142313 /DNA_START=33 /DNA_END=656 /DNA_ORIENTATION=-
MKTACVLAALIGSAAAFAPAQTGKASTALRAFEDELGAQPPLGFYDPLGLVADGNEANFDRLRYVEIKHGRVAMLAIAGYLVTAAGVRLPGMLSNSENVSFADVPAGFEALKNIPGPGLFQLFAFIGFLETFVMKDSANGAEPGAFVGDFRNGAIDFGWDTFDEETKLQKRAVELNQGRAAMMGILALMVHEKLGVSLLPGGIVPGQ